MELVVFWGGWCGRLGQLYLVFVGVAIDRTH